MFNVMNLSYFLIYVEYVDERNIELEGLFSVWLSYLVNAMKAEKQTNKQENEIKKGKI